MPSFQSMEAPTFLAISSLLCPGHLTPDVGDMNDIPDMVTALPAPSHSPLQTWGDFLGVWQHHDPEADSPCIPPLMGNSAVSPKGKVDSARSQTAPHTGSGHSPSACAQGGPVRPPEATDMEAAEEGMETRLRSFLLRLDSSPSSHCTSPGEGGREAGGWFTFLF